MQSAFHDAMTIIWPNRHLMEKKQRHEKEDEKLTRQAKQWANRSIEWCKSDAKCGMSEALQKLDRSHREMKWNSYMNGFVVIGNRRSIGTSKLFSLFAKISIRALSSATAKKLSADIIERSRRREHRRGFSLNLTFNFSRSVHAAADRLSIFHDQFEFSASRVRSDFEFGASSLVNREANRKQN